MPSHSKLVENVMGNITQEKKKRHRYDKVKIYHLIVPLLRMSCNV